MQSGKTYYYRFKYNGVYSEPGRTKTLPTEEIDKLSIAVVSCSNNPWINGAQNHQSNEGSWTQRRKNSIRAFYEWMPIRQVKDDKEKMKLWRNFSFSNLVSLTILETRHTGRIFQIDYSQHLNKIKSKSERDNFVNNVLNDANRTMLSEEMTAFVKNSLQSSKKQNMP